MFFALNAEQLAILISSVVACRTADQLGLLIFADQRGGMATDIMISDGQFIA